MRIVLILLICFTFQSYGQRLRPEINLERDWKFSIGNNIEWAERDYDDSNWERIEVPGKWENDGFSGYDGYAWYRTTFFLSEIEENVAYYLQAGYIDDVDKTFVNGELVGKSGNFPPGFRTAFRAKRQYLLPKSVLREGENTVAILVYDRYGEGGIISGNVGIYTSRSAVMQVDLQGIWKLEDSDNREYKEFAYDDEGWEEVLVPSPWEKQDFENMDGIAWYRKEFKLTASQSKESWVMILGRIDDFDKSYCNGTYIGGTADFKPYGQSHSYEQIRAYPVPAGLLRAGTNVIAIRVEDMGNIGGIYDGPVGLILESEFDPRDLPRYSFWD